MADTILIVEDNETLRAGIRVSLEDSGYGIQEAANGEEAIRKLETESFHVVVSDIKLGDLTGVDILKKAKEVNTGTEVILMTAYATVETAIQALRLGAFDYIQKPFDLEQLKHRVRTALKMGKMQGEIEFYQKASYQNALESGALVAESRGMKDILSVIRKVAPTPATVLITGETGTGKELLATNLHFGSMRSSRPIVKVNCAALHENLLESELFGHERGAFTGAEKLRIGRFEQADKGTIFLDEIGDMSPTTQSKVLRVLQEQEFERLGSSGKSIQVDVRVVAATNKDLRVEVKEGRFRQDLFFRLNVVNLRVPSLKERTGGYPSACAVLYQPVRGGFQEESDGFLPVGDREDAVVPLAGQCAGAAERDRACRPVVRRRGDRGRKPDDGSSPGGRGDDLGGNAQSGKTGARSDYPGASGDPWSAEGSGAAAGDIPKGAQLQDSDPGYQLEDLPQFRGVRILRG